MSVELDFCEYSSDALAQAAYVSSDGAYTSKYPTEHNDTYVKATSTHSTVYPYCATDPAKSLTGSYTTGGWLSNNLVNNRFHIDLGSAKIITRIYLENHHNLGSDTGRGVKDFTFWGSNTAAAFAELTYATDTNWTQLTTSISTWDEHVLADQADPQYATVTNSTAYRYYAMKTATNYLADNYTGIRRIELQVLPLQDYSESTIKTQGSYSLKGVAVATDSLNDTLTRTISSPIDLSDQDVIKMDIRASRTGSNIKIGFTSGDVFTGGTASADSIYLDSATYNADKAFDNNSATFWVSKDNTGVGWIKYDLGAAVTKTLTRYSIQARSGIQGNADQAPKDFTFKGSNNDSDWTTLNTQTGETFTPSEIKNYTFSNTTAYRYYMVDITSTGDDNLIGVAEITGHSIIEHTANVASADTFQTENIDISAVANADKDAIDSIIITITNADA